MDGKDTPQEFMQQAYPPAQEPETPPPQTPPEEELAGYPLPSKKVLKVDGAALEYVVLVPKGMKSTYPAYPAQQTAPKPATPTPPDKEKDELKKQNEQMKAELEALRQEKLQREAAELKALAESVVDKRIEKGLTTKDKRDTMVAELSKLPKEQLNVLLNDVRMLEKADAKPQPQTSGAPEQRELSERESKKKALRKELLGHEEPVEELIRKGTVS